MNKGIILAGGKGSRLFPLTFAVTKQLLPIHDKPMIYYPLSTLLQFNITDILIITTKEDSKNFKKLLGDGSSLGIKLTYEIQDKPNGIAEALIIGEKFINKEPCAFILGDNLFVGSIFKEELIDCFSKEKGSIIFTYKVNDPERYGVVNLNKFGEPVDIVEKPKNPQSNNAITGLYLYDQDVSYIAKKIKPSERNELEISDVNIHYLKQNLLRVNQLKTNVTWLDAGTISSFYEASNFISTIEKRTGKKIGCIEEICFEKKYITIKDLIKIRLKYENSEYGLYIQKIIDQNI